MRAASKDSPYATDRSAAADRDALTSARLSNRLGLAITVGAIALTAICLIALLANALAYHQSLFPGAMLTPGLVVEGSRSVLPAGWPGLNAGLRRLDQIQSVNQQSLFPAGAERDFAAARARLRETLSSLNSGDTVEVMIERDAGESSSVEGCAPSSSGRLGCLFSYTVDRLPDADFLVYFVVPIILALIACALGITVLALRPHHAVAQIITIGCLSLGLFMAGLFDLSNSHALIPVWIATTLTLGAALGTLALMFPVRSTLVFRSPSLVYAPAGAAIVLGLICFGLLIAPPSPYIFPDIWQIGLFWAILMLILLSFSLLRQRQLAVTPAMRDQCNSALIGIGLTAAPILLWLVNNFIQQTAGEPFIQLNPTALMPFLLMPPIGLVYAVLQYRTLDTDRIISQGITYAVLLIALIVGYFLLVFGTALIARETFLQPSNDPFLIALTIFVIAVLFLPVRAFLQRQIDRIYFRTRTNYQERVESFARALASLAEFDEIIVSYRQQLSDALQPTSSFLFMPDRQTGDFVALGRPDPETDIRFIAQSGLVQLLDQREKDELVYLEPGRPWPAELRAEKARLDILGTMVAVGLRGRKELIGFISLGPSRAAGGRYTFEQLRFVQSLTSQVAVAVERALVVESLERRVRELDVLSQVSQAVSFTIEFDDLLELIYAQTDRLLSAPNFYIVLRDRDPEQLYFALFVEGDERHPDRENRRWRMGRDLLSEVVQQGAPVRVADYVGEMIRRGSSIIHEDRELKAWMAAPLVAGSSVQGALAVATTDPGRTYTDDQMRIFGDLASLAATSLDKARLFAETNLRARQLAALNQISQKLASELNVENLLELITSSAVTILDAEAGSLLLVAEDDDTMLEFKVAVGGAGSELVGMRFPRNRGLVGEAYTNAQPVIVNDAANDPRWGGEVAKGSFTTSSIIAVPLMAQNRVIGVLEVLNKRGGGIYLQEDADLLTTFAGQAAIALENARLFEMTDLQLGQRVEELQALERIDVELNRSLDLKRVAEITMRWAIASSGASAGTIGLVLGDPPHLHMIEIYGYQPEDYPDGADGTVWPLDRGIVSRVMRTRQPDLVTDVAIDPNYTPSLRGSLCQMTIPMFSGGAINALLILEKDHEPRLNLVDMSFVQRLAEHASIAIANAQFYAELTRANESKSEFVSFVAHELKTPMTSIKGYTDLLLAGVVGQLADQQTAFLSTIRSNIDRMNTLVSDLNDVTKLQTNRLRMEMTQVDFRNVVNETVRPLQKQIEDRGQRLAVVMPDDMPRIFADQNRMIQVMTNLLSNAHKYTPNDGNIYITARVMKQNLDPKGNDLGPAMHVAVRDTGIGMSEEDLSKLFTPYFRSENPLTRQQPGTGLGLTITRGIVQGHGGTIWVESQLGEGTTFHFTVPLAPQAEPVELEDATEPTRTGLTGAK